MSNTTRSELRRQVAEKTYNAFPNYTEDGDRVQWEGVSDAFRAWRCEEADRIIALVTAARDEELRDLLLTPETIDHAAAERDWFASGHRGPRDTSRWLHMSDDLKQWEREQVVITLQSALAVLNDAVDDSNEDEDAVERAAKAMCDADQVSWKNTSDTKSLPDVEWDDMRDNIEDVPYEGISLGRDHYRDMARAALAAART